MIRSIYEDIYNEEELTSTPHTYNIRMECSECYNKDITNDIKTISKFKDVDECCICNEKYSSGKNQVTLNCNHIFYKDCITTWLNKSTTCPICRKGVINCDKCSGKGYITFDMYCAVIPPELRTFKNLTDGLYGIYDFDVEDLIVRDIVYNGVQKRLYLDVFFLT